MAVQSCGLKLISRLRADSVLKYRFKGAPTCKKGAPRKFDGLVDINDFNSNRFSLDLSNEEIAIYSLVVYSQALKMVIKLAIAIFYKNGKETARNLNFSTDLKLAGEKIICYYHASFQIEFLYRDAKQFTDLNIVRQEVKTSLIFTSMVTYSGKCIFDCILQCLIDKAYRWK